jgi:hypothetical protein
MSCIYYVFVNYLLIKVIEYPIVLCLCDRHLFFACGCGINTTYFTFYFTLLPDCLYNCGCLEEGVLFRLSVQLRLAGGRCTVPSVCTTQVVWRRVYGSDNICTTCPGPGKGRQGMCCKECTLTLLYVRVHRSVDSSVFCNKEYGQRLVFLDIGSA